MTPADHLNHLCQRHRVDPRDAEQLLPLVQWAMEGPRSSKAPLMNLIERTLAGHPPGEAEGRAVLQRAADQALLHQTARRLQRRRS